VAVGGAAVPQCLYASRPWSPHLCLCWRSNSHNCGTKRASSSRRYVLYDCRTPEQCPSVVSLLAESYNPHVRYGAAMALGIACAGTGLKVSNLPCCIFIVCWGGGETDVSPLGTSATNWSIITAPHDRWWIGMRIGRGNRSTRRNPAPVPLCPLQIPHDQTRARTQAATVGSRRLTAWAMPRPCCI
jgi:hypothetical protein